MKPNKYAPALKKLECNESNVQDSVLRILNVLEKEAARYSDPDEVHMRLFLCTTLTVLAHSCPDLKIVKDNVDYFLEFVKTEMEKAIKEKTEEKNNEEPST